VVILVENLNPTEVGFCPQPYNDMLNVMLKIAPHQTRSSHGFTVVELLVVIIVIGILAGVVLVAYNGIQDRTRASLVQTDLNNAKKRLSIYQARNGKFPITYQQLIDAGMHFSKTAYEVSVPGKGNMYYCYNSATGQFALGARTVNSANGFVVTSGNNIKGVSGSTVTANYTCTSIGLASSSDANAITFQGLETGTANWRDWVQS